MMKRTRFFPKTSLIPLSLLFALSWSQLAWSQNYPFPQNRVYEHGFMPAGVHHSDALQAYNFWKTTFLENCGNGTYRVKFDNPDETVSEGIAYGMLLTAYHGDKSIFDGLWAYYKKFSNSKGLMNWRITGCGGPVVGWNAATDAELDAAMALIIADCQWGTTSGAYAADAEELITAIKRHEIDQNCGADFPKYVLKPGDSWGDCSCTNPSYFAPAYYRAYAQFSGDPFWNDLTRDTYTTLMANADDNTGLVSDWCDGRGIPNCGFSGDYGYDAARTPWRIATDYLWWGAPDARVWLQKVSDWVDGEGIQRIGDGYAQDGTKLSLNHNSTFVGAFALGGMAISQDYADRFHEEFVGLSGGQDAQYFQATLRALYLLLSTGNFYFPCENDCPLPELGGTQALCDNFSLQLETGLSAEGNSFSWFINNAQLIGETDPTLTIYKAGTYKVRVESTGCLVERSVKVTADLEVDLGEDFSLCDPSLVELHAGNSNVEGVSFEWNTGEMGEFIEVMRAGTYGVNVTAPGCTDASDEVIVTSELINVTDVNTCEVVDITLEINDPGDYYWYRTPEAQLPVDTGSSHTFLATVTQRFWVESTEKFTHNVGAKDLSLGGGWNGQLKEENDYSILFDAHRNLTLGSVKVYSNTPQELTLVISGASGKLDSVVVDISSGEQIIDLNIDVPKGTGYAMNANSSVEGGNLFLNDEGANWPYEVEGVITLKGTDPNFVTTNEWYPYFYDWKVLTGGRCARTPVTGYNLCTIAIEETVDTQLALEVFPNPTTERVHIQLEGVHGSLHVQLRNMHGQLVLARVLDDDSLFLGSLPPGVYFMEVRHQDKLGVSKIFVE